jgi:Ammonium Transporter Family
MGPLTEVPLIAQAAEVDTGDTAWMLTSTALVLLMTIGLGIFYAGLVRSKNALNTFMMCVSSIAIAGITWALIGYSLAFDGTGDLVGGLGYVGLHSWSSPRSGRCSSTPSSPTGASAAAGCSSAGPSTSPAGSRSRWRRASRR